MSIGRRILGSEARLTDLDSITLVKGTGSRGSGQVCAMQAVMWLAGEKPTGRADYYPTCTSHYVASIVAGINDALDDDDRQKLKPYLPKLIGCDLGDNEISYRMAKLGLSDGYFISGRWCDAKAVMEVLTSGHNKPDGVFTSEDTAWLNKVERGLVRSGVMAAIVAPVLFLTGLF